MRVYGNVLPETLLIEPYAPSDGYVEVRLREDIKEVTDTDPQTGIAVPMYEYDEYIFLLKNREGLRDEIEANLTDWLATGRTLEVNPNASVVAAQRRDINAYEQALSEIEVALGVTT